MRKVFFSIFVLLAGVAFAHDIVCVGLATQVVRGTDTTFVFRDEIHLKSTIGDVEWFAANGQCIASGVDEIYPDEGVYRIKKGNTMSGPFRVKKYTDIDNLAFTIEPTCDGTVLHVTGDFDNTHTFTAEYNALAWNGEEWTDSVAQVSGTLAQTLYLPPLYGPTPIRLCYDAEERATLGLAPACVEAELQEADVKAVNMMMTSLATARGKEGEKSNELNRPTRQDIITATTSESYSGALEVAFYSNPTPGAQFYRWTIYKANERIATRNDKDIRYSFAEPANYRVVCSVNNRECQSDSSEMIVNISESYLRVPNFFTPGGSCGNAEFRVAYRSLREFHIWVYNRWGKLVYESTDPAKGWDGTINGRMAADGAYFYVVRALGTDAAKNAGYIGLKASYKKQKASGGAVGVYQLSGDINLLRCRK